MRRGWVVIAVLCGLLSAATAALWAAGRERLIGWRNDDHALGWIDTIAVHHGGLYLITEWRDCPPDPFSPPPPMWQSISCPDPVKPPGRKPIVISHEQILISQCETDGWGFGAASIAGPWGGEHVRLRRIPLWLPAAMFAGTAAAAALFAVRRRFGPGRCHSCRYDLRATPERCPECRAGTTQRSHG